MKAARVKVTFPPLSKQKEIAAILSAYDDLIENNTRRIRILEEMARLIYREWFVEFRAPGVRLRKATPQEQALTGQDRFPEGWEIKPLGAIADDVRDGVHPSDVDPDTPYFGLEHLPRKSIALDQWGKASEVQSTKLLFKKGDILFGKIRPYFHKVGVAAFDGVCSSDAIVIRPKDQAHFGVVLFCCSSDEFVSHATQTSQGTKMPRANWDILKKYPIAVPAPKALKLFNDQANQFVELIQNLVLKNINLRQTRDLLLPKLLSGRLS